MNKIKLFLFLGLFSFLLFSCKSVSYIQDQKTDKIIATAKGYQGTKYKYGGTDKRGMDCSGLVYTSFLKNDIKLPRTSLQQSNLGQRISLNKLAKGDLLFFKNPNSNHIDHVGLIVSRNDDDIKFIHSSSSRGVIISSIKEAYWKKAFIKGKRIINSSSTQESTQSYQVKSGDTLYGISKKYNTSVQSIKKLNNLKSDEISIGMILRVL